MALQTPVILVSGSLGCGKTSYVRALVRANPQVRFGVIVNEFGEIGVDGDLLSPFVPDVIEIRNGCMCCVTQDQLVPAIREVISKYAVDVLLVEMSGAADPAPIARQIASLAPLVSLKAHVVLGDCTLAPEEVTTDRTYCTALARAGIVALSKSDIATDQQVASWHAFVTRFNPGALLIDLQNGEGGMETLLNAPVTEADTTAPDLHAPHSHTSTFHAVGDMAEQELQNLSERLGGEVVRMKGIVRVDGRWSEIQRVRTRLTIEPYQGTPPDKGRLVFISRTLRRSALQKLVNDSLAASRTSDQVSQDAVLATA